MVASVHHLHKAPRNEDWPPEQQWHEPEPEPKAARPVRPIDDQGDYQRRVLACTDKVLSDLSQSQPGTRNPDQFKDGASLFELWLGAELDLDVLEERIYASQVDNGQVRDDGESKVRGTIRTARETAERSGPRYLEDRDREDYGRTDVGTLAVDPAEVAAAVTVGRSHMSIEDQGYHRSLDELLEAIAPYEAKIFDGRESLRRIRETAFRFRASPIAVLGSVLTRVLLGTPPTIRIQSEIGFACSVNTFLILAGQRSEGKDLSDDVGKLLVPQDRAFYTLRPASGEALASAFFEKQPDPDDKRKNIYVRRNTVLFRSNEISALLKTAGREGAILYEQMCIGFSGQGLGQDRANRDLSFTVDEHTYRLCVIASAQPQMTDPLFQQQQGVAERWLWVPAGSREVTSARARQYRGASTEPLPLPSFMDIVTGVQSNGEVIVPDAVTDDLNAKWDLKVAGLRPTIEGHGDLTQLRVMWALALIDGRVQPNFEDWRIADDIMAVSNLTREWCRARSERAEVEREVTNAKRQGVAASVRNATARHEDDKSLMAAAIAVARVLLKAPDMRLKNSGVMSAVAKVHKPHLRRAYTYLESEGVIERNPPSQGRQGAWLLIWPDWLKEVGAA